MRIEVFLMPRDLRADELPYRAVVVFDVLRATTTMTAGLAAGVAEIRIFDSLEAAQSAARQNAGVILAGERATVKPLGFDLGNSPGQFIPAVHADKTVFMATTNGTLAIMAARKAQLLLVGAIVNATAVARQLVAAGLDISLLCSGTNGEVSMEDMLGAGAVIDAIGRQQDVELTGDVARIAQRLFLYCRDDLRSAMRDSTGGHNIRRVQLDADIDFAAKLDSLDLVGVVTDEPLRVTKWKSV